MKTTYRVTYTDYASDMGEAPTIFTCDRDPTRKEIAEGLRILFEYMASQNRDHLIETLGEYETIAEAIEAGEAFSGAVSADDLKLTAVRPEGVLWEITAPVREVNIEEITIDEDGNEDVEIVDGAYTIPA